jgi:hypothetical protein
MRHDIPEAPSWKDAEFFREGEDDWLPDLFVESWTSPEDWERFLQFVATGPWRFDFTINGETAKLPNTFRWTDEVKPMLHLRVGRLQINCHFFGNDDFELTLNPVGVKSEVDHNGLLEFMARLADSLHRPVYLCAENNRKFPLFVVNPRAQ